ncbi:glycosyltransferase [uncultured Mycobacterium sp.]|uniref:glycosyltransferase n=1 Tax=uncultured Mycobacterium sp. TaxID=171292 RepID=UPI0035CB7B3F
MKFLLAGYGTRGDVEPCAAVGLELLRRGHGVRVAVPPNRLNFVESAGLDGVGWGPSLTDLQGQDFNRDVSTMQDRVSVLPELFQYATQATVEMGTTLTQLAEGADLLVTGTFEPRLAATVAEYYDIPVAALHPFPIQVLAHSWPDWRIRQQIEEALRRALALPEAAALALPGKGKRASLEIQAYDELLFPWLAAEWAECDSRRPFVGALTLELATDADDDVLSWIAAGTPPIYFGFGSTPLASPVDTLEMFSAACAQLGERALICTGENDFTDVPHFDHVKVVGAVNHTAIFPACRAVVHHGGAGTTAASMRAGTPTLILWFWHDQPSWAAQVTRLKVGAARPFSATTVDSLVADLRSILAPQVAVQAREIATQMTKPADSVARAADLVVAAARHGRYG